MAHKRSEKAAAQGKAIELALKNLRAGKYTSVNSAAKAHGVAETTLRTRWKGGNSQAQGNEVRQLLSENEEKALVKWITELSCNGFPPRKQKF